MQDINQLQARLCDLEAEKTHLSEQELILLERHSELRAEVDRADAELLKAPWQTRDDLQAQRCKALSEVSEVSRKIAAISPKIGQLSIRIVDVRRDIARFEYEAVSLDDLLAASQAIALGIAGIDDRVRGLSTQRDNLNLRQTEAETALDSMGRAEEELQSARNALEKAQGEAFISGAREDLSAFTARLTKAEKRLASAKESATVAQAAMPRIAERLAEIEGAIAELEEERAIRTAEWWSNRARQTDTVYRIRVHDLIDAIRDRVVIDKRAGGNIGWQLLQSAREGLRVPVLGRGTESVNLAAWFGTNSIPEVTEAVDRIEGEFNAAIQGEELSGNA